MVGGDAGVRGRRRARRLRAQHPYLQRLEVGHPHGAHLRVRVRVRVRVGVRFGVRVGVRAKATARATATATARVRVRVRCAPPRPAGSVPTARTGRAHRWAHRPP